MTVAPFVLGVITTLAAEFLLLVLAYAIKKGERK